MKLLPFEGMTDPGSERTGRREIEAAAWPAGRSCSPAGPCCGPGIGAGANYLLHPQLPSPGLETSETKVEWRRQNSFHLTVELSRMERLCKKLLF